MRLSPAVYRPWRRLQLHENLRLCECVQTSTRAVPSYACMPSTFCCNQSPPLPDIDACSDGGDTSGPKYLVADPTITCWESDHLILLIPGGFGIILFLVGVPALYFYIIFKIVRVKGREHAATKKYFGFLYYRYEPEYFYFEFVELTRKLILSLVAVFGAVIRIPSRYSNRSALVAKRCEWCG